MVEVGLQTFAQSNPVQFSLLEANAFAVKTHIFPVDHKLIEVLSSVLACQQSEQVGQSDRARINDTPKNKPALQRVLSGLQAGAILPDKHS